MSPREGRAIKVIKGSDDGQNTLWVVIENDAIGDETMSGFLTKREATAFYFALCSHSFADAEKLRRAARVRVESGKYTTPRVFWRP
jgi:hypothetical protein